MTQENNSEGVICLMSFECIAFAATTGVHRVAQWAHESPRKIDNGPFEDATETHKETKDSKDKT